MGRCLSHPTKSFPPGGGVLLFLIVAFLIYAYLEQRKRNHEVVFDTSRYNLARDRVVTLIPAREILIGQSPSCEGRRSAAGPSGRQAGSARAFAHPV